MDPSKINCINSFPFSVTSAIQKLIVSINQTSITVITCGLVKIMPKNWCPEMKQARL